MRNMTEWTKEGLEQVVIKRENVEDFIKELKKKDLVISDDFVNIKDLKQEFEHLYEMIKIGFTIDELREYPIKYRYTKSSPVKTIQLRHLITNMILWYGILRLGGQIREEHIINANNITGKDISNYYDNYYVKEFTDKVDFHELNKALSDTTYELGKISLDFNIIMGMSISLETYLGTAKKFPRFKEILKNELSTTLLPNETEDIVESLTNEQVELIRQDEDSMIKVFLDSKEGVKKNSLQEFVVASSNKPDIAGKTMPIPITKNFLMGGLSNLINYYIDAVAGRKSIVMNKTEMGKSGYISFLTILNSSNVRVNKEVDDCGTVNTVLVDVKSKKHFDMIVGRWYVPERGKLELITPRHTHLIGQSIRLRSPIKCACEHGICHKCAGTLYKLNMNISLGAYSAIMVMRDVQQKILSAKHILTTTSNPVIFTVDFSKYFQLYSNEILLDSEKLNDNPETESLYLIVDVENDVANAEELDIFDKDLSLLELNQFYIGKVTGSKRNKDRAVEIISEISEENGSRLSITQDLIDNPKFEKIGDYYCIKLSDIDDELSLFSIDVVNTELTKPLYEIKGILESSTDNSKKKKKSPFSRKHDDIDGITNDFFDAVIDADIDVTLLNIECIIYPLVRKADNKYERPNFKVHVFDSDVQVLTIKTSLTNNPSIAVKLASESIKSQLLDLNTYEMDAPSFLDDLFREKLLPLMKDEDNDEEFIDDGLYDDEDDDDEE